MIEAQPVSDLLLRVELDPGHVLSKEGEPLKLDIYGLRDLLGTLQSVCYIDQLAEDDWEE